MEGGRSFKTMFSGKKDENWLSNVAIENSKNEPLMDEPKIRLVESEVESEVTTIQQNNDLEDSIKSKDEEIETLKQNHEEVIKKNAENENLIFSLKKEITSLKLENSQSSEMEINNLKNLISEKNQELIDSEATKVALQKEVLEIKNQHQNLEVENQKLLNQIKFLENEKAELLKENELKIHELESIQKEIEVDETEDILEIDPDEVTSAMAENGRLAMLNHELETRLNESVREKENAEMLYLELRSLMCAIGVAHNLEVFDQQKIELAEKTKMIQQLGNLLNERDQYITEIQNSLMSGIGAMFQQRPTGLLENIPQTDPTPVQQEAPDTKQEIALEKNSNEAKKEGRSENYFKRIDADWKKIKDEAKQYLDENIGIDEIAVMLDIGVADLDVIINSRNKQMKKITGE